MSGRELDPDGTDSYHPDRPWEQVGHVLYLPPAQRTPENWPPNDLRELLVQERAWDDGFTYATRWAGQAMPVNPFRKKRQQLQREREQIRFHMRESDHEVDPTWVWSGTRRVPMCKTCDTPAIFPSFTVGWVHG